MRLLFLEGDVGVRRWLIAQAQDLDIELLMASGEREALGVLSRRLVDAVIVDVAGSAQPSSLSWYQLRRRLSALAVPLLTYASVRQLEVEAARLAPQWGGYLPRPFTLASVVDRLGSLTKIPPQMGTDLPLSASL